MLVVIAASTAGMRDNHAIIDVLRMPVNNRADKRGDPAAHCKTGANYKDSNLGL